MTTHWQLGEMGLDVRRLDIAFDSCASSNLSGSYTHLLDPQCLPRCLHKQIALSLH